MQSISGSEYEYVSVFMNDLSIENLQLKSQSEHFIHV